MTKMMICFALCLAAVGCGDVVGKSVDANPCPGTVCECTAATEATDCGAHEACDESGGSRVCACVPTYTDQGGTCVFTGGPTDFGFQDPTKWTPIGTSGVMVLATATGKVQPGEAAIDKDGACQYGGIKQTFTMPPFDRADPMKLSVTYTVNDPMFNFPFNTTLQIGVGSQFMEVVAPRNTYKTSSFCLGPGAFGGPVTFQIAMAANGPCTTTSTSSVRIDEMKLELAGAGECPREAGVVNGGFQLATGWSFPNVNGGAGQILPNIGENGTFAAQLTQATRCSDVSAEGTISVPSEAKIPHPALDVYWNGTSGARLAVSLAGKGIGTLNANGQIKHSRICIPKWAVGNVSSLSFFAQRISDNNCTALSRTFILDNMTIVDEPACGMLGDVTDPSFERITNLMGPVPGWALNHGYVNDVEGARAFIINNGPNAASGTGVLRTSNSNPCVGIGEGGADFAFIVPPASGTSGPAVKFSAKADVANVNSETRALLLPQSPTNASRLVPETGAHTPNVLCIPPTLVGRLVGARLTTGGLGGGCAPTTYEEFGFFDDVSVGTDPSCPAQ
ncbi:MAG: hypothetical protein M4D80_03095 [Myxococcota bacterium]|nr:hypothetical protein [Deltaproteobacteria bacterium]MDQ3334122.1 hypothetical protein [Myxococcota bacterium]